MVKFALQSTCQKFSRSARASALFPASKLGEKREADKTLYPPVQKERVVSVVFEAVNFLIHIFILISPVNSCEAVCASSNGTEDKTKLNLLMQFYVQGVNCILWNCGSVHVCMFIHPCI